MGTSTPQTSIAYDWISQAQKLTTGQSLYIQCETREIQDSFYRDLLKELKLLRELNPIEASTLSLSKAFKDNRHWVYLKRSAANPYVGFVKDSDGNISRVGIQNDAERYRRYSLMIDDGWTKAEIEESEGITFTEEEIKALWPKLRKPIV